MVRSFLDIKKENLEKRYATLLEQYSAASAQHDSTLNAADRVTLKTQMTLLEEKITKVESELENLGSSSKAKESNGGGLRFDWQEHLPKINYEKARTLAQTVLDRFEDTEGGALFLLQDSDSMGGEWFLPEIRKLLDEENGKFRYIAVGFSLLDPQDEQKLLDKLRKHLNSAQSDSDLQKAATEVIETLCNSLQSGSTVFIEITVSDSVALQERLLPWFVESFWCPLLDRLPELAKRLPLVKFVTAFVARGALSIEAISSFLCCAPSQFDSAKILELPLENWTEVEIKKWLIKYSGLNLKGHEYDQLARQIYQNSKNGLPSSAHWVLTKTLREIHGG